jgi:hypothetical protein
MADEGETHAGQIATIDADLDFGVDAGRGRKKLNWLIGGEK